MAQQPDRARIDAAGPPGQRSALAGRVRATLVLVAGVTAVLAQVAHYGTLRAAHVHATQQRLLGWVRHGATQLADLDYTSLLRADTVRGAKRGAGAQRAAESFRRWSLGVLKETNVLATAVMDAHGKVLLSWPPSAEIEDQLPSPAGRTSGYLYEIAAANGSSLAPDVKVAIAPIDRGPAVLPVAYTCVLAAPAPVPAWLARYAAIFASIIIALAGVVVLVALRYLQTHFFDPLARLSTQLVSSKTAGVRRLPVERTDELGLIARRLHELGAELETAQQHANRLEQSIDSVVTRETKQISRLLHRAEREAEIDALTGLANRRFIEERLEDLFKEQVERGVNLAIVMFDVDDFKPLNDGEGHVAGDSVLRFVGELLRGALRDSDVGVRYGGDEFAIVLVDVTGRQVREIAERVVRLFAQRVSVMNLKTPVTLSAGIASLEDVTVTSGAELLRKADEALYESKRKGKNLVVQAGHKHALAAEAITPPGSKDRHGTGA